MSGTSQDKEVKEMALTTYVMTMLWIADSGASCHITATKDSLTDYEEFAKPIKIGLGNEGSMNAEGEGMVRTTIGSLHDVYYALNASGNLFSISAAAKKGICALVEQEQIKFMYNGEQKFKALESNGLYFINFTLKQETCNMVSLDESHRRLGHVSKDTILRMSKLKAVDGLDILSGSTSRTCENCGKGKCKRASHSSKTSKKASKSGTSIHFDTVGPFKEMSLGGAKYMLLCKDEFSSYTMTRFVSDKSEITSQVKQLISKTELDTGNRVLQRWE